MKSKSVIDWREHYDNYPYVSLGVALGGGLVLAGLLARRSSSRRDMLLGTPEFGNRRFERRQPVRYWVGVAFAAYKVAESLYNVLPVFRYR